METTTPVLRGSIGVAVLRVALGLTGLFTWFDNVEKKFYDGANLPGYFDWLSRPVAEGGNGSSLGFVHSIIENTLLQAPEFFGWVLTFFELFIAIGLVFGVFTRAASLGAIGFYVSLFLAYFGGAEWIWTYVILAAAAIAIFLDWGGRKFGVDEFIAKTRGESPGTLVW